MFLRNFQVVALIAFCTRLVVCGASLGDALALIGLAGLCGFYRYIEHITEPPVTEELLYDVGKLKESAAASEALTSEVKNLKSAVESLKLGVTYRSR